MPGMQDLADHNALVAISAQHTPGPWKVEPTNKRGKKFFVVRELRTSAGHWAGLEFMKHSNGGARHFSSVADARAAIAKATGSAT